MIAHARRRVNGHHTEASPTLARFVLVHPSIPGGGVVASHLAPVVDALTAVLATPESPHFWLDVERIRPDEMDALADLLGLHEVTIFARLRRLWTDRGDGNAACDEARVVAAATTRRGSWRRGSRR